MNDGYSLFALQGLRDVVRARVLPVREGKRRVAVQLGHCSDSVGAGEVASLVRRLLPEDTYMVITGCDGACFDAPRVLVTQPDGERGWFTRVTSRMVKRILSRAQFRGDATSDFLAPQKRVALDLVGELDSTDIDDYILNGGYEGLARALDMSTEEVIEEVKASGLRGRGGAYFPAAIKWQSARSVDKERRYLIVNSEEGEPGIFKDRHLMEGVPHRILEGAIVASYASGVARAYIYINAEANLSAERMQRAIDQATRYGLLGADVLGSGFSLEIEIRRGAGGYVCGEETTLLNTMEGYRREPRLRPPFPTESGLWEMPTVINNPETLASVPFILSKGALAFSEMGTESDKGTKLICLSGSIQRAGTAEVEFGTTIRTILYDIGGGVKQGQELAAVAVGGPSSGILPVSMLDTAICSGTLHSSGVILGAGGVIALDKNTPVLNVVRSLAAYNAAESCGKCTPCREGTPRIVQVIDRLIAGDGSPHDLDELRYLARVVREASLCGLGQAAGGPITSALHFFGDEIGALAGVS